MLLHHTSSPHAYNFPNVPPSRRRRQHNFPRAILPLLWWWKFASALVLFRCVESRVCVVHGSCGNRGSACLRAARKTDFIPPRTGSRRKWRAQHARIGRFRFHLLRTVIVIFVVRALSCRFVKEFSLSHWSEPYESVRTRMSSRCISRRPPAQQHGQHHNTT